MVEDEKMTNMTQSQVVEACRGHKYLLFRRSSDFLLVGVNCALVPHNANKREINNKETRYIGYRSCAFMEYLTYKLPFTQPLKK